MLRATRAFTAMLTLGALACTFDHSGSSPGSDEGTADAADDGAPNGTDGSAGAEGSPEGDMAETGDEGTTSGDGSGSDAQVGADSPTRLDGSSNDASQAFDGNDGSSQDAHFDCTAVSNGATFTPPGASAAHCYWLHSTANNWLGAVNACAAERGHLVTLSSSAETMFVQSLVPFASTDLIWIGATDGRFSSDGPGSGPFMWITGEPMTYQNWASSGSGQQPDGLCQSCMGSPCNCEHRVAMMSDGRWDDLYEALYYRFVCEGEP
jgi:hypothetical protein